MTKYTKTFADALKQVREPKVVKEDYEVSMAIGQLKTIQDRIGKIMEFLSGKSDDYNMEAWLQSKITSAEDKLNSVANYVTNNPEVNEAKEEPKEKDTEHEKPPPSINQHTAGGAPVHGANTLLLEESPGHLQIPIAGGPMNGHEAPNQLHMPPTEQLEQPPHGGLPAWMAHTHPFQRGHVPGQVYNNHIHEHKKIEHIDVPQNAHYPPVGSAIHAAPHMLMPLTPGR
jgi:hypothetical protein